jgi:hypothetical protein
MYFRAMLPVRYASAVAAAALALCGCGSDDERPKPAETPPLTTSLEPIDEARDRGDFGPVPREQRALARRVIARDTRLQALLGDTGYRVGRMGPWSTEIAQVGLLVDLRLERPLTREDVRLPVVNHDDDGRSYRDGEVHLAIVGADELTLLVEFRRAKVVSIEPKGGTSRLYPDNERRPPRPGGSP